MRGDNFENKMSEQYFFPIHRLRLYNVNDSSFCRFGFGDGFEDNDIGSGKNWSDQSGGHESTGGRMFVGGRRRRDETIAARSLLV